ncbi:terminase large subunit domain-containing protein [Glutamicibacter sp. M10]|uniref:terminase large subunit domain-containing protein n=1 Tax=Glutamicibacter sp. M10 TaxID=3023076 RepID=UPI0021C76632|nr:terminase large subunit [Glutamicibacter sp. M10]UXN30691.1 terminase large subunit [Glutamicibacter sp. M10]
MAGPKAKITAEPLDFTGWPRDRAKRRIKFIEKYLIVPKGHGAGKPVKLREFQKDIIRGAYAPGIRTGLCSLPRGNGKSGLAAMMGLAEMFMGPMSPEVFIVASDLRQAKIIFNLARRMVQLNPVLEERVQIFQDRLYMPHNDATMTPLPADYDALQGLDPTFQIVDELHTVTEKVWEAVVSAAGKRPESLTLAISTPANSPDSVMWGLVTHGRAGDDPQFYFKEYAAPDGCAIDDREAWKIANPALACEQPFLAEDALLAVMKTIREPVFRQLRLGMWITGVEGWMPWGMWDSIKDNSREVQPGERIVMAFDGSASGDSTALVGCTVHDPHLFVIGHWANPGDERWRVPRAEVSRTLDEAFEKYDVVEAACDPWGWRSEIESWAQKHGERRVIEWNTANATRMAPATDRLFQAVKEGTVSHDGDKDLASHVAHCVAKSTALGDLVAKDRKNSPRKIDLAICAIVATDRAAFHGNKKRRGRVISF